MPIERILRWCEHTVADDELVGHIPVQSAVGETAAYTHQLTAVAVNSQHTAILKLYSEHSCVGIALSEFDIHVARVGFPGTSGEIRNG
ncbi:MAG: hypothetical protein AAF702_49265 [Chloroflexota bacterium]